MKPKKLRQEQATARNAAWSALTPTQQIKYLDEHNLGAKRQRARLAGNEIVVEAKTMKEARGLCDRLHTEAKNARREAGKEKNHA